jgi:hypothetical protein
MPRLPRPGAGLLHACGLGLVLLAGCQQDEIHSYQAPRHNTFAEYRYTPLRWTTPGGWEEVADMGAGPAPPVAAFRVTRGRQTAEVTVTTFPGQAGGVLANINRWRGQVGKDAIKDEADQEQKTTVVIGGTPGFMVDLSGPKGGVLAAVIERDDQTWVFKMGNGREAAPQALVDSQKAAFQEFLNSVRFEKGEAVTDEGGAHE